MNLEEIKKISTKACAEINQFATEVLVSRGGRIGSGMGMLIEALWGYYMNQALQATPFEVGWLAEHQYNDFVFLEKDKNWQAESKEGELFRIEVKSMNMGAEESKAHFDVLEKDLPDNDLLMIIIWNWKSLDTIRSTPYIIDHFIGFAKDVAQLRDALHLTRGGTFVKLGHCPEDCTCDSICKYDSEPLNAAGKRERLTGPNAARPSLKVSYAANFGGLLRMLKTSSEESRSIFRQFRRESDTAHAYISFIHRNFLAEEENQYTRIEWLEIANRNGISPANLSKIELINQIRRQIPNYHEHLRLL